MRCPNCNKFVPYGDPEVELTDSRITGSVANASCRIVLRCAECGEELKDVEIETELEIEHVCEKLEKEGTEPDYEFVSEPAPYADSRTETKDRNGRPIKNARYMKTFYGFTAVGTVKCNHCNKDIELEFSGEEQASGFNELV